MENLDTLKTLVQNAGKILLVFPYYINADSCSALGLLHKLLKDEFKKEVDVASSVSIPDRFSDLLQKSGIQLDLIKREIEPVSYVITVGDILKDNVDVKWHKKENSLNIVLTPDSHEVNFDKVTFSKDGGIYDLVFTVNIAGFDDMGSVYKNSPKMFRKYDIVTVDFRTRQVNGARLSIIDKEVATSTEAVLKLMEQFDIPMNDIYASLAIEGIVASGGMQSRSRNGLRTLKTVARLAETYNVNLNGLTAKYFNSYSKEELRLLEKMYHNLVFNDEKGAVYSVLKASDFQQSGAKPSSLRGMVGLPFNLNKNIDYAFLAFQSDDQTSIILQANTPSADLTEALKKLGGYGDKYNGIVDLDAGVDAAINQTLDALFPQQVRSIPQKEEKPVVASMSDISETKPVEQTPVVFEPKVISQPQEVKAEVKQEQPQKYPITPVVSKKTSEDAQKAPEVQTQIPSAPQLQTPTGKTVVPVQQEAKAPEQSVVEKPVTNVATQLKSPFEKASEYIIDQNAVPGKQAPTFNAQNKPFNSAQ